jgi:hypothetical protein
MSSDNQIYNDRLEGGTNFQTCHYPHLFSSAPGTLDHVSRKGYLLFTTARPAPLQGRNMTWAGYRIVGGS